ncbi:MAG: STAS domain-containing protein [Candidatus Eremiobacteraeota bacterium]|nr:STAS domain-containing protein [Candidatus Eremiobacteraeota bacterium]
MASDQLSIDVVGEPNPQAKVFALRGTLDMATSPSLRSMLLEATEAGKEDLIIDLTRVEYIDSTGLGSLIGAQRRAQEHNGRLRLVVKEGPLSRLFNITGLVRVFGIYPTVDDALGDSGSLAQA